MPQVNVEIFLPGSFGAEIFVNVLSVHRMSVPFLNVI